MTEPRHSQALAPGHAAATVLAKAAALPPAQCLALIGDYVKSPECLGLAPAARLQALARVDEQARPAFQLLRGEMLSEPAASDRGQRAWTALLRHCEQFLRGYAAALLAGAEGGGGAVDARQRNLALARALAFARCQKKLLRMRVRNVDATLGDWLCQLYGIAEACQCDGVGIRLYEGEAETTARGEFLAAMAFDAAPWQSLNMHQMELLDLLLQRLSGHLQLCDTVPEGIAFSIDTGRAGALARVQQGHAHTPNLRYVGIEPMLPAVAGVLRSILSSRAVPESLALPAGGGAATCVAMLRQLILAWSRQARRRRHERNQVEAEVDVVHGFDAIRAQIGLAASIKDGRAIGRGGAPLDGGGTGATAGGDNGAAILRWRVFDVSAAGLGVQVDERPDWLEVGSLVGIRFYGAIQWTVTIVRRLAHGAEGALVVGLESLAGEPTAARLGPSPAGGGQEVLLLDGTAQLVMAAARFQSGAGFSLNGRESARPVRLVALTERGPDFDLVQFETVAAAAVATPVAGRPDAARQVSAPAAARPASAA